MANPLLALPLLLAAFLALALFAAARGIGGALLGRPAGAGGRRGGIARPGGGRHRSPVRAWGLRFKLAAFTIALVLLVVILTSAPLIYIVVSEQQKTLRVIEMLGVYADPIAENMHQDTLLLERSIAVIALAVLGIGIAGAWVLSSLLIRPIRRLVRHVQLIHDAGDRENLAALEIHISSRDEIETLGDAINKMTRRLAATAATESELSMGKEIQKKFIPLELDRHGSKLSSGYRDAPRAAFFGYYAGAKGISGDYFDYQELGGGRYYAIIKCDAAGKGIPAALIMIQVATMFLNYFKEWQPSADGMRIEKLVYQINGFIETLGFQGRFAAFTLCIFDSESGELHFCNAGDNIVHIFDAGKKRVRNVVLPQTPAAGVLPNALVEEKGGYRVQSLGLNPGDILLLYTDGIEEAKRSLPVAEELGAARVHEIINAVMNRRSYRLGETGLQFDFSKCRGGVDEPIMALIAVEKMFRCYCTPHESEAPVLVEKKVDAFLKEHFLQYRQYCARTREHPGNNSYIYYTHLREDEQYDDLTILGIKRK